ncbi:alpha/beta hydrolase [Aquihabitans sp. G128]|uniref:alpha/beta fold hydrolase n=1 Tax=Aquihabitans sp. G128 TaxID=2849779 RepID=UPI001C2266C4|nr:alpha/beta hydrolase [Aquihabitans sp. G128]QXC60908.1 alpha/beta hydrolase [Aquihabitans sp. G128]
MAPGLSLAYVHEGVGGIPLLLVHGYPETKRIWWRNIGPLAAAGFEVIAVDLRGAGDSDLSADDAYDIALYAKDLYALVHDVLGHERCTIAASDVGGVVATDLVHRYDGFVERLCTFNTVPPMATEAYAAAGLDFATFGGLAASSTGDYRELQGARPDELAAMLTTDAARRQWVAGMYTSRLWGSPGGFTRAEVDFMTEPFADEARLRAGWAVYQLGHGRPMSELPLVMDTVDVPTLLLYGPDDHVVPADFLAFAEVAYTQRIGPLVVPGAGHFLQWERADVFNPLLVATFGPGR